MRLRKLYKKTFYQGNTIVCGLRGRGKDMLFSNVIARCCDKYISNIDYQCKNSQFIKLDINLLNLNGNTFDRFINNNLIPYSYPYEDNVDIFISDSAVYFPSQYQDKLCKMYPSLPLYQALSRHLGNNNIHYNVQNLNRLWDKCREQCDNYIFCNWCKVLFGKIVIQVITIYDKYESCENRVQPFKPLKAPLTLNGTAKALYRTKNEELFRNFTEKNGSVKRRLLIYINKSNYNTRLFKDILQNGGLK